MIDPIADLMKLTPEELDEKLLDPKYNKANLRELVRRSLRVSKQYQTALDYELYKRKDTEDFLDRYDRGTSK